MPSMPGLPLLAFTRRRAWRIFAAPTTASMRLGVKVPARRQRARLPRTRSEATGEIAPNSVGGNGRDCPELGRSPGTVRALVGALAELHSPLPTRRPSALAGFWFSAACRLRDFSWSLVSVCSALPCAFSLAGEASANKREVPHRYYGLG